MIYTIENTYLNLILMIFAGFFGILIGLQLLGSEGWIYKTSLTAAMFLVMCGGVHIFREANTVRLTQTGIQLPFHKEIPYTTITSYEETTRITSANGRTVSRSVIAVTTAAGVTRIPINGDKKIIIDAIEAGRSGNGSELLSILHRSGSAEVNFRNTVLHYSFAVVVSIIPLLIVTFIPQPKSRAFDNSVGLTREAAQEALYRKDYNDLYQITKNHIVQHGIISKTDCDIYDLLVVAEKNLGKTERFPTPPACK